MGWLDSDSVLLEINRFCARTRSLLLVGGLLPIGFLFLVTLVVRGGGTMPVEEDLARLLDGNGELWVSEALFTPRVRWLWAPADDPPAPYGGIWSACVCAGSDCVESISVNSIAINCWALVALAKSNPFRMWPIILSVSPRMWTVSWW